ncbi:Holliday junction branch migration protein RuvA [Oceanobacillus sp. J11TS1]|uniref:Holliday junction branch migration protein RuvA n=1 Tax=Oceanobacillus sp. J11TS1 TaxID=2807191 RepID=UPI001B04077D|nr:Holliday junction branch migration protein RuvA [Oceanobacillus sp. J11TS1]GIO21803.1 Holliday junction ATP-dependent DNA helicase RuvA [Oceanobacillus sp. J11TS1]
MIAYIKGMLVSIKEDAVIVDVHGIGYEIICPNPYVFEPKMNQQVQIHTFHHVREDAQILFGFRNTDEKYLFTKLISVSGIGPKGALAILAGVNIQGFIAAVENEDEKFLTGFPGVGKKTARQIILDLKGKLINDFTLESTAEPSEQVTDKQDREMISEALDALKSLGFTASELKKITPQLKSDKTLKNTDEVIRKAFSLLAK